MKDKRFSYDKSYAIENILGRHSWSREFFALPMFFSVVTLFTAHLNRRFSGPTSSEKGQVFYCVMRGTYDDAAW